MRYEIKIDRLVSGERVQLPASKSISNRALIMNALCKSPSAIGNLAKCDDTDVLVAALNSKGPLFDVGAAGTSMRFLTAFLANKPGEWEVTGSERMRNRPIGILVDALNQIGARIEYAANEGFPPLRIHGRELMGGQLQLNGGVSSQYISALLMIAPTLKEGLRLELMGNIISKPYIALTLGMLREFGIQSSWNENVIEIKPQEYRSVDYVVESDWSAASYWYEIAALSDGFAVELPHLYRESMQGDSHVREIFAHLGVETSFTETGVRLQKSGRAVSRFCYDFINQPDLAQTVVVTCCCMGIPFEFGGLQSLKIKETDRIEALKNECLKIGFVLKDPELGTLLWDGERIEKEAFPVIATYEDHRMAMAFAPAALCCGPLCIDNPKVVSKSYPDYWAHLRQIGVEIQDEK